MDAVKFKKLAWISGLSVLLLIGSTTAFLTSRDSADNSFQVAKVDLKIEENFDKDKTLAAGEIITKEPWVKNTGTTDQIFFAEVYVPCMNTTLVDSQGRRIAPAGVTPASAGDYRQLAEIFNLLADGTPQKDYITEPAVTADGADINWELSYNQGTASSAGWFFLRQEEQFVANHQQGFQDGTYNVYLFGYSAAVPPEGVTIPIFNRLQLRSMVDAEIKDDQIGQVTVSAFTLQANELNLTGLTGNGSASSLYTAADLAKIYQIYQNKSQGGTAP